MSPGRLWDRAACLLAFLGVPGCADPSPPFEDLSLRDALRADPEVIASLPPEARAEIADRLTAPADEGLEGAVEVQPGADAAAASLLLRADAAREADDRDAVVLADLQRTGPGFVLLPLTITGAAPSPPERYLLQAPADARTADIEQRALDGRAGAILHHMGVDPAEARLVRVTGFPVGALLFEGDAYVNASWLVALAEDAPAAAPPSPPLEPPRGPQSVRYNPYNLPPSLGACAADVLDTCTCAASASCSHRPADATFSDANAECSWVNESGDASNAAALCALALLSIDGLSDCLLRGSDCGRGVPPDRAAALAFVQDIGCYDTLDRCVQTGNPDPPSSSSCSSCSGCDTCERWDRSCDQCNEDCDRCRRCSQGDCAIAAHRGHPHGGSGPGAPLGWLWMLLPPAYVALRMRRRS